MASGENSKLTYGGQSTIEQEDSSRLAEENEAALEFYYLSEILPQSSPIHIPKSAKITPQHKEGYSQVKYQWQQGEYKYTSRWHTKTPGAPSGQGDSWVVERHLPGIGAGPHARPAKKEVLIGVNKWISKATWNAAIRAKKNGTATQAQKELLNHGHWKA